MSPEARGILRNAGLLVMGASLLMVLFSFGAMLWMDIPLLLVGAALVAYAWWDERRARKAAPDAPR